MANPIPARTLIYIETVISNLLDAEDKLKQILNASDIASVHRSDVVDALQSVGVSRQILKIARSNEEEILDEYEQRQEKAHSAKARRNRRNLGGNSGK